MSKANEVTIQQYTDGFDVDEPVTGSTVKGTMVRFKDDSYLINGTDHLPESVRELTVVSMLTAWVRWWDEKPTHHITLPGQQHPRRDELGDLDEKAWPKDKNGTRSDPLERHEALGFGRRRQRDDLHVRHLDGRRPNCDFRAERRDQAAAPCPSWLLPDRRVGDDDDEDEARRALAAALQDRRVA
jgi:hypothetical protein